MFDKKEPAEAVVLEDEGGGRMLETDSHGEDWEHYKYILEVRPAGQEPFRVETKVKAAVFSRPRPGDLIKVLYEPKNNKTEMLLEGDPRYDPKIIRANRKQEHEARAAALLSGAPLPVVVNTVRHRETGSPWTVPANCPECGARVDQSKASMAEHPACQYCAQSLPCRPAH